MALKTKSLTGYSKKGIQNVLISEAIITKAFTPKKSGKIDPEKMRHKKCSAIWDTGATNTAISKKVVEECDLKPTGMTWVQYGDGKNKTNTYLVNLWLPMKVVIYNLRVTEGTTGEGTDVLIGMDIINRGDFAVTNKNGKTVFTYRFPSVERIDFVKNPYKEKPIKINKVGRNDPCPCGSGKKYKKCCGK